MARYKEITVPDIGDFQDVDVIEVLVNVGDSITADTPLITLESDKATMEVPSPVAGTVQELLVKVGDKVSEGSPILAVAEAAGEDKPTAEPPPEVPEQVTPSAVATAPAGQPEPAPPTGAATAAAVGGTVEVKVPDIGDFKDVEVIEVMAAVGDQINAEDPLITLESDKATMDVPSTATGTVREMLVQKGDRVSEGSPILRLEATAPAPATAAQPPTAAPAPAPAAAAAAPGIDTTSAVPPPPPLTLPPPVEKAGVAKPHASPSIRRFGRELGVDLSRVRGTGPKGRILKEDVQQFVKRALAQPTAPAAAGAAFSLPEMPEIDFSKFGEIAVRPLNRIKRLTAVNLHRSWLHVPHVTQHDEADITELEAFRKSLKSESEKQGLRITPLAFLMKACVAALREYPSFNASLERGGENLILKMYYHIGIAVDTPDGLVVPVVRDVDKKGIFDLARELGAISTRARDKKLSPNDMQGGSFTISSLGGIGGTAFTPIVNAPEVAILGVSRSSIKPVYRDTTFVPRLMLPLSLSYDHRVIDGAEAARFTAFLANVLGDVRRLLL